MFFYKKNVLRKNVFFTNVVLEAAFAVIPGIAISFFNACRGLKAPSLITHLASCSRENKDKLSIGAKLLTNKERARQTIKQIERRTNKQKE